MESVVGCHDFRKIRLYSRLLPIENQMLFLILFQLMAVVYNV